MGRCLSSHNAILIKDFRTGAWQVSLSRLLRRRVWFLFFRGFCDLLFWLDGEVSRHRFSRLVFETRSGPKQRTFCHFWCKFMLCERKQKYPVLPYSATRHCCCSLAAQTWKEKSSKQNRKKFFEICSGTLKIRVWWSR